MTQCLEDMMKAVDLCCDMLKIDRRHPRMQPHQPEQLLQGIRILSWRFVDACCNELQKDDLTRQEIDDIAMAALMRLGYNAAMFPEVSVIIEAAVATDGLPMTERLAHCLASWRGELRPKSVAPASVKPKPAKQPKPQGKKARKAEAEGISEQSLPPAIKPKGKSKQAGDRRAPTAKRPVKPAAASNDAETPAAA